jgi:predicted nuclease of predicted toxin-antitoxin system
MKIRFQADADLNEDIVLGLTRLEPQIDFQTASEAGLRGLSDLEVLSCAAGDNRILVSHDRRTMPMHFAAFVQDSTSPGVFIIGQNISVRTAISELVLIWSCSETEEWTNLLVDIPL